MSIRSTLTGTAIVAVSFLIAPAAFAQTTVTTGKQQQVGLLDDTVCPAGQVRILDNLITPGSDRKLLDDTVKPGSDRQLLDDTVKPAPAAATRRGPKVKPGNTVAIQDSLKCKPAPVTAPVKP